MQFLKSAWKILVALKDGLALLFLILFFVVLFSLLRGGPNPAAVRDGALVLALEGFVSEQPAEIDPIAALTSVEAPVQEYRQRDIIRALDLAAKDDRVKAVVLDLDRFLGGGQVSLSAIGERLDRVKKAGKPVYSFATAYTDDGYQLAAHATQIWLDPMGGMVLTGPGGARAYYKDLLDKVGVTAHVFRVGTYKSAVEPYLRRDQSPESKEAIKAVYDEVWGQWRAEVSKARPQANLDPIIKDPAGSAESAKGNLAALAFSNKLVDTLGDRTAFGKFIAGKVGKDDKESMNGFAAIPAGALLAAAGKDEDGEAIGVVTLAGEIVDGEAGPGSAASETVSDLIYDALDNEDLKALVIRVDSPGGSVTASEEIRLAIAAAKAKKIPVIVSMANLAASGGYWVSTPADAIFAEPATITGSIGIFAVIPSGEKALGKIGINTDGVKTTPLSGEPNVMGGLSPDFERLAQSAIENGYRNFLDRVASARGKTAAQVDTIGQGRVWAGGTARQLGLVDRFGGIDDALTEAAKRAGLPAGGWHPLYLEPKISFAASLLGDLVPRRGQVTVPMDIFAHAAEQQQHQWDRLTADVAMLTGSSGAQIRCLECSGLSDGPVVQRTTGDVGWFGRLLGFSWIR
jgi:protease IV